MMMKVGALQPPALYIVAAVTPDSGGGLQSSPEQRVEDLLTPLLTWTEKVVLQETLLPLPPSPLSLPSLSSPLILNSKRLGLLRGGEGNIIDRSVANAIQYIPKLYPTSLNQNKNVNRASRSDK